MGKTILIIFSLIIMLLLCIIVLFALKVLLMYLIPEKFWIKVKVKSKLENNPGKAIYQLYKSSFDSYYIKKLILDYHENVLLNLLTSWTIYPVVIYKISYEENDRTIYVCSDDNGLIEFNSKLLGRSLGTYYEEKYIEEYKKEIEKENKNSKIKNIITNLNKEYDEKFY